MGRLLDAQSRRAKLAIKRFGTQGVEISRPDGTASTNDYGKVDDSDQTYSVVATEMGHRTYGSMNDRENEARVTGGHIDSSEPLIMLADDTAAQEDDRVTFPDTGQTFELDERIPLPTHALFRATLVNG